MSDKNNHNIDLGSFDSVPRHIAVIMDGNRRWAKNKLLPSASGHKKGVDSLRNIIKACIDFGVKYLTVYAFSTENKKREKDEVDFLMALFAKTIVSEIPSFSQNGVRVRFLGAKDNLDSKLIEIMNDCEAQTCKNSGLNLQIAFNYGSRNEITNAFKSLYNDLVSGNLKPNEVTEDTISGYLYTKDIPDPDLLIRTGGEFRISNFLLWQAAYSEIYVTDTFWPDFDKNSLFTAIRDFNSRNRRFGK